MICYWPIGVIIIMISIHLLKHMAYETLYLLQHKLSYYACYVTTEHGLCNKSKENGKYDQVAGE